MQKLSLNARLLILFISLLVISVVTVGATAYFKAYDLTQGTIEKRLLRETALMNYLADNLKFVYISDEEYFMQEVEVNVRNQQATLIKDGIAAEMFYITGGKVIPFKVSGESLPDISDHLVAKLTSDSSGIVNENIAGEQYTIAYKKMQAIDGTYALLIPTKSYMAPVYEMAYFIIAGIITSIIVLTTINILFVRTVTKPLNDLRNTMREVREGKLQPAMIRTNLPELTSLQKSYNAMIEHMRGVLHELQVSAKDLEETGEQLNNSSEGALSSSERVVSAIQVVKIGAEATASSSEQNAHTFKEMKRLIEKMAENMSEVFKRAERMDASARIGEKSIQELIHIIYQFEEDVSNLTKTMNKLNDYTHSITKLIGIVNNISEQTKLLALNASIEAARAGEAGKGFSVVAQEVGKLAEQSKEATEDISLAITNMESISTHANNEFEQFHSKINKNLQMANQSRSAIDDLMGDINETTTSVKFIHGELIELGEVLPKLEQHAENFTFVAQETLASSENMLAESSGQMEQMEKMNEVGKKLHEFSKTLRVLTEKFSVK